MEKLAILDCGGQYTKVIDRKVRELGVYTDIMPMGVAAEKLNGYGGIIFSGGPASVWENSAPEYDDSIFDLGIPMLGICYGMQLTAHTLGGKVWHADVREYGRSAITYADNLLFDGVEKHNYCWMSHTDQVNELPDGFKVIASTATCPIAAYCNEERRIYAVQFHPEASPGPVDTNFLFDRFINVMGGQLDA